MLVFFVLVKIVHSPAHAFLERFNCSDLFGVSARARFGLRRNPKFANCVEVENAPPASVSEVKTGYYDPCAGVVITVFTSKRIS